ncbi:5913_t:CDS:2 [Ambispora gerdemannii]|uniref:5913_t:CDS:1 n=1 Tax=Ambispora gerdemannii TaxID=144530 RepID=A0A9N9AAN1_9GLOM|nr:5913_t:CDS:2 [Ambispora gerdemannii]
MHAIQTVTPTSRTAAAILLLRRQQPSLHEKLWRSLSTFSSNSTLFAATTASLSHPTCTTLHATPRETSSFSGFANESFPPDHPFLKKLSSYPSVRSAIKELSEILISRGVNLTPGKRPGFGFFTKLMLDSEIREKLERLALEIKRAGLEEELTEFVKKYSAAGQFSSGLEALGSGGALVDFDDDKSTKPATGNKKSDGTNKSVVDTPSVIAISPTTTTTATSSVSMNGNEDAKPKSYVETPEERASKEATAKEAEVSRGMIAKFFGSLLALFGKK